MNNRPNSINELIQVANRQRSHWFDTGTMNFFGTRIESELFRRKYFLTSEQPPYGGRMWSIREVNIDETGHLDIDTVGEFAVMSKATAQRKLKELLA